MLHATGTALTRESIQQNVSSIVGKLKHIEPGVLAPDKGLWEYNLDILDIVDIILAVEKKFKITIPDEVPVYSIDDFVNFVELSLSSAKR